MDLKSTAGQKAAFALCLKSDVVVENWRPGVAARLGLGYEILSRAKPQIIYCAVSAYGQTGPSAKLPGLASLVEARSGFSLAQMKLDKAEKPQTSGLMLGDTVSGVWAFAGIQTALLRRERTGAGAFVDLAMHDAMLFALIYECHEAQFGTSVRRSHVPLRTKDGYMQVPPITERNFHDTAKATGHTEWIEDPRFNSTEGRNQNWFELLRVIEEWTSSRTSAECLSILAAAGVPCATYRTAADAMLDPHLAARGSIATIQYGAGDYRLPNPAFQIEGATIHAKEHVPKFDQHNEEVLGDVLGYSQEQILACRVKRSAAHN